MNSKYVYSDNEFGNDADLGFSFTESAGKISEVGQSIGKKDAKSSKGLPSFLTNAGTGATIGATVGSAVPVVGTAIGGAVGTVVGGVSSFIGSGPDKSDKDEVHSKTVGNLPEALLNMNRLDSPQKAREIAISAVNMGLKGKSFNEVGKYIDASAGYEPKGPYLPSDGALYPWGQIYRHWKQAVEASAQAETNSSNPVTAAAGGGNTGKYVLIGGGVLVTMGIIATMAK